ncbi:MAG TPA: hypothetical protein VGG06_23305, partial [Thermoanaerobaculia bacterium]
MDGPGDPVRPRPLPCYDSPDTRPPRLTIAGADVDGTREITAEELANGVVLVLGARVALLLHVLQPSVVRP